MASAAARSSGLARRSVISLPSGSVSTSRPLGHPHPEPRVQFDQRAGPGELGRGEGQMVAPHRDRAARRVAQPHHGRRVPGLGQGVRRVGRVRRVRRRAGRGRPDGAAAEQLPQRERKFGRVQRRTGGQGQHPGRACRPGRARRPAPARCPRRPRRRRSASARPRSAPPGARSRNSSTVPSASGCVWRVTMSTRLPASAVHTAPRLPGVSRTVVRIRHSTASSPAGPSAGPSGGVGGRRRAVRGRGGGPTRRGRPRRPAAPAPTSPAAPGRPDRCSPGRPRSPRRPSP